MPMSEGLYITFYLSLEKLKSHSMTNTHSFKIMLLHILKMYS